MVTGRHAVMGLLGAVFALSAPAALSAGEVHALVIGIDNYKTLPVLDGGKNDARDLADALETYGATSITMLLDEEATRARMLQEWQRLSARAGEGDTILVTFSGHGSQIEDINGDEDDEMDEALVLYDGDRQDGSGLLVDDDIAKLIDQEGDALTIFITDACHSGTVTRSIDPRASTGKKRFVPPFPAPQQSGPTRGLRRVRSDQRDNLLFMAAAPEEKAIAEITYEGEARGALSVAVAFAMREVNRDNTGMIADADKDGILSKGEFSRFVNLVVSRLSEGRQQTIIQPEGQPERPVLTFEQILAAKAELAAGDADQSATASQTQVSPAKPDTSEPAKSQDTKPASTAPAKDKAQGRPALTLLNASAREEQDLWSNLESARQPEKNEVADFIFDASTGEVVSDLGDVVASLDSALEAAATASALDAVMVRWAGLEALKNKSIGRGFDITLDPGNGLHRAGERVTITTEARSYPYLTVAAIASTGRVTHIYPLSGNGFNDPLEYPPGEPFSLTVEAEAPFGADHLIALASAGPATDLHKGLSAIDGSVAPAEFYRLINRVMDQDRAEIAIHGVYTAP